MSKKPDHILFGAAYYDEYMPEDRLDKDIALMKRAHINVVRIAESTWSTMEPQPGVFDFSHIDRVLDAMGEAGIDVVIGTPTYAFPSWLSNMYPDVLEVTHKGKAVYGGRQIMNITDASFLFYAERAIRRLIAHVAGHKAVIGYQVDNECKYYDVVSNNVQKLFVKHLREKFHDDLDAMNLAYGLDYWSNRINSWDDFPDVTGATGTINGSLGAEFDTFRRSLVTRYIGWQADIVREYARPEQWVTHNYDLEWRGYSYGLQPWADDYETSKHLDIAGVDIYHPGESHLTGREIGMGGDLTRSFKGGENWLLIETQAQGQNGWLPYPGQLRLQAYSHLANGADSVMYWHWHSIHNSFETYWKGLLSHDFEPNPTYEEAGVFGGEIERIGSHLVNLRKRNKVAVMVSNKALTALTRFTIETGFPDPNPYDEGVSGLTTYNDVMRWLYDALFDLNIEADFVPATASAETLAQYQLLVVPALYVADEDLIGRIRAYVADGGNVLATFKSFVADDNVKVYHDRQPHDLTDVFGVTYNQFTNDMTGVELAFKGALEGTETTAPQHFLELLKPADGTEVLADYGDSVWGKAGYAAITRHAFGKGTAEWVGTMTSTEEVKPVLLEAARRAGVVDWSTDDFAGTPVRVRRGVNESGKAITYLLNYSGDDVTVTSPIAGTNLLGDGAAIAAGDKLAIPAWGVVIIED